MPILRHPFHSNTAINEKRVVKGRICAWWRKFTVVLWKCMLVRKRHYVLTTITILLPILLFGMVGYARSHLDAVKKTKIATPTYNDVLYEDVFFERYTFDFESTQLLYAPNTSFTNDLMRQVQLKMGLLNHGIQSFETEEELVAFYNKFSSKITFGVVFHEVEEGDVPKKLVYDIRNFDQGVNWQTRKLFQDYFEDYTAGMGSENYFQSKFLSLQMAIDREYIYMRNSSSEEITLALQEFPYPPYTPTKGLTDILIHVVPFVTMFSFILICPTTLKNVAEERNSGIKDLMQLMGLPSHVLWLTWFVDALLINVVPIVVITVMMGVNFASWTTPLEYTNPIIFGLFLTTYCASSIVMCFVISLTITNPKFTIIFGILFWHLTYIVPYSIGNYMNTFLFSTKMFWCLYPNIALYYGYEAIAAYEVRGLGAQWGNLLTPPTGVPQDISLGHVLIMSWVFVVGTMIIMFIGSEKIVYLKTIPSTKWPGKRSSKPITIINQEEHSFKNPKKMEHCQLTPGIRINKLKKTYESKVVVNDLTVDFYKGEITILLGHNGAGKTTTMSIISGLVQPTEGDVQIGTYNVKGTSNAEKPKIGICPQHDLLLPDLSVEEHLQLFGKLNNVQDMRSKVADMLNSLNLTEEKGLLPHQLSGGMKRKLSLGIALISNPEVLILDEPTSSLDPKSRREIWNILLEWQKVTSSGNCTTLITTHYMEEAEVLGNRIALIDHGNLVAFGSSMFLKQTYNTGHYLTIVKKTERPPTSDELLWCKVKEFVQEAVKQKETELANTYLLQCEKKKVGQLVAELESKKEELGIETIIFENTTMEDVFMKMSNQADDNAELDTDVKIGVEEENCHSNPRNEPVSFASMMMILLSYRFLVFRKTWPTFVYYVIFSMVVVFLSVYISTPSHFFISLRRQQIAINLNSYGNTKVFCSSSDDFARELMHKYESVVLQQMSEATEVAETSSVSEELIRLGETNIESYKQRAIAAAEFNLTENGIVANVMYSNLALHGAPISLNLVTNAIAKMYLGDDTSIVTTNIPLPKQSTSAFSTRSMVQISLTMMMLLPIGPLFLIGYFIIYPYNERSRNLMQLMMMTGIRTALYWTQLLLFDLFWYIIAICLITAVVAAVNPILYTVDALFAVWVILLMYGAFSIPLAYFFSACRSLAGAITYFQLINLFSGFFLALLVLLFKNSGDDKYETAATYMNYIFNISPHYWLSNAIYKVSDKSLWINNWNNMDAEHRRVKCHFDENPCCQGDESAQCLNFKSYSSLYFNSDLIILCTIHIFLYFGLLVKGLNKPSCINNNEKEAYNDDGIFSCKKLKKMFSKIEVLKDLKFSVKSGKCFGILGTNGAGKSTAMKILTGQVLPEEGTALVRGENGPLELKKHRMDYLKLIGYCPQVDATNDSLNVKEMLILFARLRGAQNPNDTVNNLVNLLGLKEYENTLTRNCSGGNKRKLNLGISLLADPKVIILDEPTAGVDPASRRTIWNVLNQMKMRETSLILTSHSMDECEVLCDDIAIMKSGKVLEQGNISNLKINYIKFYTIQIKVNGKVDEIKMKFENKFVDFHPKLKNKHEALLEFYIPKGHDLLISTLFNKLEDFKEENEHVVDYNISMASLEDVFLNITKTEKEEEVEDESLEPLLTVQT